MDPKPPYEEGTLVTLLKRKDQSAFNALYDQYAPALYTLIIQITQSTELGNKVIGKVFLIIWQSIDDYDPGKGKLFTWMLRISRTTAIEETRLQKNLQGRAPAAAVEGDFGVVPELTLDNCGLKEIINKLGYEQKKLVNFYYYEGIDLEQIAATESIPKDMVKININTALSALGNLFRYKL